MYGFLEALVIILLAIQTAFVYLCLNALFNFFRRLQNDSHSLTQWNAQRRDWQRHDRTEGGWTQWDNDTSNDDN